MAKKIGKHNGQDVYEYLFQDFEVKAVGENELEIVGSTEALDRDGEVLKMDGWDLKEWKKNPVILPAHDYTAPAIAKGKVKKSDGKLKFKITFPEEGVYPLADIYRKLYKDGFMRASSVGFMPTDWKYGEGKNEPFRTYLKQKLLELSLVSVPSNPEALSDVKGMSLETVKTAQEKGVENQEAYDKFFEAVKEAIDPEKSELEKPYENEHSCDLSDKDFDSYRRKNCDQKHDGKCIDVVYGIKDGKSEISSLRYKKDVWSEAAAKKHCKGREGKFEPAKQVGRAEVKEMIENIDKSIESKIKEVIEGLVDKKRYQELLFGSASEDSSKTNQEKEKTDKLIDTIKNTFK